MYQELVAWYKVAHIQNLAHSVGRMIVDDPGGWRWLGWRHKRAWWHRLTRSGVNLERVGELQSYSRWINKSLNLRKSDNTRRSAKHWFWAVVWWHMMHSRLCGTSKDWPGQMGQSLEQEKEETDTPERAWIVSYLCWSWWGRGQIKPMARVSLIYFSMDSPSGQEIKIIQLASWKGNLPNPPKSWY